ncbi:2-amino-4-hydroxy-6-hydroxymethyldihydropteridine diphosphokinase [Lactiplantibacillus mudanjiangensis]|uniref:2-amino-4-hydroxy-6-hydroxymethyldihydropteridine diphosphokinase n=1 Tax=Lactiplantibacillus mudanjiangensis TaxID=1296538 RepID=A0A660E2L7_9LACO|nr:2-amino-4-hydroxy-6-hydroxymethyldihydropteridine diphosphokinase [Lactiplantibacillus mudanjiangensis]VDG20382.1 2-amino-4-hydroxy-6-hydroxymethyldihydropteridinediphosphokinase [Lactobacillus pentosus] [Lactiplantibacillus mudanjiangensis]VDG23922.1 2-amino-4-hydroxy-6-hydroxymethyldihydropteridinediphosphokinase [Lactobacillus pentosus] [Lactiplantibacillus mudanjiangensis]VDG27098.1 2-amino-4-hydroxy-6-hydroxymethyldihydropteridinediphosphokinase [Lactobacillus pentosus] [Lactiplantibacil
MTAEERVYLSVGSNIHPRVTNIKTALQQLADLADVTVVATSNWYETEPWGNRDQANFYNVSVALTTSLTPDELLDRLHEIEQGLHRQRQIHWGPRTIDLDIIFWGARQLNTSTLIVPHAQAAKRNFVLLPTAEIAADDPIVGPQVAALIKANQDNSWIKKVGNVSE